VIRQVGEKRFVEDSKLHGAGGIATYTFEAAAVGTAELRLAYSRPWEKDTEPAERFALKVTVK
jgi:inhibitor of cysteine peptidase